MRTTLVLDDRLFKRAKQRAAERGTTLSEVVNEALSESLAPAPARAPVAKLKMITFGNPGEPVRHEPEDLAAALISTTRAGLGR